MNFVSLYNTIIYEPLFNGLMFLYHHLGTDMGIAIILLTLLIKLVLFYPSLSQLRAQRALQATQPKLKQLQEQYKDNKEEYSKAVLQFYKENKVNPFASCLPLLIQLPILFSLYHVFIAGIVTDPESGVIVAKQLEHLYGPLRDIYSSTPLETMAFGFLNLAKSNNYILAGLAAAATFWQSRMLLSSPRPPKEAGKGGADEDRAMALNRNMAYVMPVVTFIFAIQFPAGLALYWLVSTLFQVGQQYYFLRRHPLTT